jgi:hypothetical protein
MTKEKEERACNSLQKVLKKKGKLKRYSNNLPYQVYQRLVYD